MNRLLGFVAAVAVMAAGSTGAAAGDPRPEGRLVVVRFAGLITDADRLAVDAAGLEVIGYEPPNGYVAWDPDGTAGVPRGARVSPLPVERKLHPHLRRSPGGPVEVSMHTSAAASVRAFLSRWATVSAAVDLGEIATLAVHLPSGAAAEVAGHPAVLAVAPAARGMEWHDEATNQIQAGNLNASRTRPVPGYDEWLGQLGVTGKGVSVAVVDTAIQDLHPDLQGRVQRIDYRPLREPLDTYGHGTHVAGIVGGAPPMESLGDVDGFVYGTGVAPEVRFVDQAFGYFPAGSLPGPDGIPGLTRDAWRAGARIQNNSWGLRQQGLRVGYVATTRGADVAVRDADAGTPGSQQMALVFSAGNEGQDGMASPQEAKNIVAVAASLSGRLLGGATLSLSQDIDAIADFSSRGPTTDGRVFPTVTAPGAKVMSARAFEATEMSWNAFCFHPPDGAMLYYACSGTSFAAPHVSGAAALIHEWWSRRHGELPSPAMVKALLVNSATDLKARDVPNRNEGWGRVTLSNVLQPGPAPTVDQDVVLRSVGDGHTEVIDVDGSTPFRVTVAWTDAPAVVGASPALVNDLDLVVERLDAAGAVTATWRGNVFSRGQSVQGGGADRVNNLENVWLDAPQPGRYRIRVEAANLPGDGIPDDPDLTDQDFALVVRGAAS
ncbi:MAG: S8 family serine peptidase [Actinomycetota bacterium]|nr:S8 family serine peptidase [Actinomycetota bacterium]